MNDPGCAGDLIGRTILHAQRVGVWLELLATGEPDPVLFYFAGGRMRVDLECVRCGEWRLVEIVETARGKQGFCSVCAHSWVIE